jgi:hypothetical protein
MSKPASYTAQDRKVIRVWAQTKGYPISTRGRIPREAMDAWEAQSPEARKRATSAVAIAISTAERHGLDRKPATRKRVTAAVTPPPAQGKKVTPRVRREALLVQTLTMLTEARALLLALLEA